MAGESSLLMAWINFFAVSRKRSASLPAARRVAANEQISKPDSATSRIKGLLLGLRPKRGESKAFALV